MNLHAEETQLQPSPASTAELINQSLSAAVVKSYSIAKSVGNIVWIGFAIAIVAIALFNGLSVLIKAVMWILIIASGLLAIAYGAGCCKEIKTMGLFGASGKLPCLFSVLISILLFALLPNHRISTGPRDPKEAVQYVVDQLLKEFKSIETASNSITEKETAPTTAEVEELVGIIKQLRRAITTIPADNCPLDFQTAFMEFQQALLSMQNVFTEAIEVVEAGFWTTAGEYLFGDLFNRLEEAEKEVRQAKDLLERTALKYGVVIEFPSDIL